MATRSSPAAEISPAPSQAQPKSAKAGRLHIPAPQVVRVMQRYAAGESLRKIAREEQRDRATVTKIIRSDEMAAYVCQMREKFYGLGDLAIAAVRFALEEQRDAQVGYRLLLDTGVVPTPQERERLQNAAQAGDENSTHKKLLGQLVECALERAKIYGTEFPELDGDLRKAGARINVETGELEPVGETKICNQEAGERLNSTACGDDRDTLVADAIARQLKAAI